MKEWSEEKALQDVKFNTITFFMQIHGLPPNLLHPDVAFKIDKQIGGLHEDFVTSRVVVAQSYLRVHIEIQIDSPILARFFQSKKNRSEKWIQFKYERLPYFCFKCGTLDHVSGRCRFSDPAIVTNVDRVVGPTLWTLAPSKGRWRIEIACLGNATGGIVNEVEENSIIQEPLIPLNQVLDQEEEDNRDLGFNPGLSAPRYPTRYVRRKQKQWKMVKGDAGSEAHEFGFRDQFKLTRGKTLGNLQRS
ncbi:hypothetical protein FNV43_RR09762 [Rhamnella rubrinervis]|uniref:Zinc knuckle CX2CX4HX4C domain-containing protein n=1 Tax=Rhamnella rubrinervis TaxID=2594499 RepID=A0A8K0HBX8_9ROSA|nr:hypothetical protein FNV43_RR09762 [Rhamnella rubrinervis]